MFARYMVTFKAADESDEAFSENEEAVQKFYDALEDVVNDFKADNPGWTVEIEEK